MIHITSVTGQMLERRGQLECALEHRSEGLQRWDKTIVCCSGKREGIELAVRREGTGSGTDSQAYRTCTVPRVTMGDDGAFRGGKVCTGTGGI